MKIKNPENIVFGLLFGGICLTLFLYNINTQRSDLKKAINEHPLLETKDSLNNEIISLYNDPNAKYTPDIVYVTLNNGRKYRICSSENRLYYPWNGIFDAIQVGDRLIKEKDNDTLYISKKTYDDSLFFYIIEPLKK